MDKRKIDGIYDYYAFISYTDEDTEKAQWMKRKLTHYRFPADIREEKNDLPSWIRPVFEWKTDTSGGDMRGSESQIQNALFNSKYLIVICSPHAVKSEPVNGEIQDFIKWGREKNIIPFIVDGHPHAKDPEEECFPPALLELKGERERKGIFIDNVNKEYATVAVISTMFDINVNDLWKPYEREHRKKRRLIVLSSFLLAILGLLFGLFFFFLNKENEEQRYIIQHQNDELSNAYLTQELSLIKSYLSSNRPELAIIEMKEISKKSQLFDSINLSRYNKLKHTLYDSLLTSSALLVSVSDTIGLQKGEFQWNHLLSKNTNVQFAIKTIDYSPVSEPMGELYIHSKITNTTDTIPVYESCDLYTEAVQVNNDYSLLSAYVLEGEIRVYSLESGEIMYFVNCECEYPSMSYPLGLSNDGTSVIYKEATKYWARICVKDFSTGEMTILNYSGPTVHASFSPDGKFFFIHYDEENTIDIYSNISKSKIHTFKYDYCDGVYWNDSNNICISSCGQLYIWKIVTEQKGWIFQIDAPITGVSISKDNKLAVATSNDRNIYVWDMTSRRCIWKQKIFDDIECPKDAVLTNDNKVLWIISSANNIQKIDIERNISQSVSYEEVLDDRDWWEASLYMTADSKYCISYYDDFLEHFRIYDMNGKLIGGSGPGGFWGSDLSESILSEFVYRERFDNHYTGGPCDISAKRFSTDGKYVIEGYIDGTIKYYSSENDKIIRSVIL